MKKLFVILIILNCTTQFNPRIKNNNSIIELKRIRPIPVKNDLEFNSIDLYTFNIPHPEITKLVFTLKTDHYQYVDCLSTQIIIDNKQYLLKNPSYVYEQVGSWKVEKLTYQIPFHIIESIANSDVTIFKVCTDNYAIYKDSIKLIRDYVDSFPH